MYLVWSLILVTSCALPTEKTTEQKIESLFNIRLPTGASHLEYIKVYKSSEFEKPYYVYIRARMSKDEYLTLVQNQLRLTLKKDGEETKYTILLLSHLRSMKSSPIWWDPPQNITLGISAAGEFRAAQNGGWIIATYHDGFAYFKAYEEGSL